MQQSLPVLVFLQRQLAGDLLPGDTTHMLYPTAISRLLDLRLLAVEAGEATLAVEVDTVRHGNQQGTVHGGFISELADAAIGTAHSTFIAPGESFASIELSVRFLRPVWQSTLRAMASALQCGKTISHYECLIYRDDDKLVASATSTVMTLRGDSARGR